MWSRTPPISSEFRGGGLNTPNPPRYATACSHMRPDCVSICVLPLRCVFSWVITSCSLLTDSVRILNSYIDSAISMLLPQTFLSSKLWKSLMLSYIRQFPLGKCNVGGICVKLLAINKHTDAVRKQDTSSRHATSQGPSWRWSTSLTKYIYVQGVPGGMCQTSGECSLC